MSRTVFVGVLALLLLLSGVFGQNVYRIRSGGQADDGGGDGVVTPATRAGTVVLKNGVAFPGDLADGTFSTDLAALKAINADPAGSSDPLVMDVVEWEEVRGPFKMGRPVALPSVPVPGGYGIVAAKSLSFVGVKKDGKKPVVYGGSCHVLTPASDAARKSFSFQDIHWRNWWQRHICLSGDTHDFTLKNCEFTLTTARGRSFVGPLDLKGGGVVACWCPWIAPNIFDAKAPRTLDGLALIEGNVFDLAPESRPWVAGTYSTVVGSSPSYTFRIPLIKDPTSEDAELNFVGGSLVIKRGGAVMAADNNRNQIIDTNGAVVGSCYYRSGDVTIDVGTGTFSSGDALTMEFLRNRNMRTFAMSYNRGIVKELIVRDNVQKSGSFFFLETYLFCGESCRIENNTVWVTVDEGLPYTDQEESAKAILVRPGGDYPNQRYAITGNKIHIQPRGYTGIFFDVLEANPSGQPITYESANVSFNEVHFRGEPGFAGLVSKGGVNTTYSQNKVTGAADAGFFIGLPGYRKITRGNTYRDNIFAGFRYSAAGGHYILADASESNTIFGDSSVTVAGNLARNRVLR